MDPVLYNDWHPVALSNQVAAGAMLATDLLETRVVLWRDSGGELHAWEDRCPHRGTRLSMGTLHDDTLRCPYHGWSFGKEGRCIHIPALPQAPLKAQVATYHVQEQYGMAWVCLGTPAHAGPPAFPEFADDKLRKVWCGHYDVQSSAPRIVENFLDMAHFAFVHEGILGDKEQPTVPDYTVESFDDPEYGSGVWAKQCYAWQPQASRSASGGSDIEYTYRVVRPLTTILTKHPPGAIREAIALFSQPLTETSTRVWIIMALNDFVSSYESMREFQDTIFMQDKPILESQHPARLPLTPGAEVSVLCDRMSLAYRSYLKQQDLQYGVIR
ncbi:Phenylpropionate dioxygenase, large terminal subunit [Duganella sp. CF402]|uniref:aromatic ring-hydroxylating dioxygenase subunit alpha n=1 Tax=unclassified Duganella TaxID=2636909 RepID=UPI0008BABA44|nr:MULTISPECIES: aromatic ring-hydroxylating dioxygenase subunit alpha [unclassified Duganella]RZT05778.1 phenylpropionate dioxygenase-like ring-hydroxylating dioxygenase large terminal subunit [Duganella sp. BK701]SEM91527.1 Phenylpropionate dioxygenase, large terminal subunit [Duganella sp. CF402]